jgi:hypothetical protein
MFAELYSDINSPKSSLLHLTGQPYSQKSRSPKVKDGIINLFLRTISLIDTQTSLNCLSKFLETSYKLHKKLR